LARPGSGPGLERDERLEDLCDDADRLAVRDERAIDDNRIRSAGKDERPARLALLGSRGRTCGFLVVVVPAAAGREQREHEHGEQEQEAKRLHPHLNLLSGLQPARGGRRDKYRETESVTQATMGKHNASATTARPAERRAARESDAPAGASLSLE
jgi:hypothetical protein